MAKKKSAEATETAAVATETAAAATETAAVTETAAAATETAAAATETAAAATETVFVISAPNQKVKLDQPGEYTVRFELKSDWHANQGGNCSFAVNDRSDDGFEVHVGSLRPIVGKYYAACREFPIAMTHGGKEVIINVVKGKDTDIEIFW